MYETLKVERHGALVELTLNRPERLNALSRALVAELAGFFDGIAADREARVVILGGAGRAFCAGLDLKETTEAGFGPLGTVADGMSSQRDFSRVVIGMRRAPQPIIAAVHGAATGGGFSLALAADVRIAAESARMNAAYVRIGLTGCDMGSSYLLPRMVGASVAAELLMTGNFVDAARAEKLGLVSKVVPDVELQAAARALAEDMLRTSPLGLRLTKEGLNANLDAAGLEQALVIEDRNQILCARTEDFREGVKAFLEKRAPKYRDA
jgi:enoyl-CoA hydratase/carnithine racemase